MEMVFRIQPHVRLHEWVAGKRGFLTEEGVDYGLEADGCQTLRALTNSENADDLHPLTELVESSAVAPAIDRTYPLSHSA